MAKKPRSKVKTRAVSVDQFLLLKEALQRCGSLKIRLVSGSMAPILPVGAFAVVTACTFDELRPFDIVVYHDKNKLICHLIWHKSFLPAANGERTLISKGLASAALDFPVRESMLLGRVTSHSLSTSRKLRVALRAWWGR